MTLAPEAQSLIDKRNALAAPPYEVVGAAQAAASFEATPPPARLVNVKRTEDRLIPGPGGELPVRIYWPTNPIEPTPLLVFLHGGGWVIGSIDSYDRTARELTEAAGCITVSVGYRLAPAHRFPAAADDAFSALQWAAANAEALGATGPLVVGGDSAGGNLAASAALRARHEGGPEVALQVLVYPVTDFDPDTPSMLRNRSGYLLTRATMEWFHDQYCARIDRQNPYAAPLLADTVAGVAPAYVLLAGYDPLFDEGLAYAHRLITAGVPTTVRTHPGQFHGFLTFTRFMKESRLAVADIGDSIRRTVVAP